MVKKYQMAKFNLNYWPNLVKKWYIRRVPAIHDTFVRSNELQSSSNEQIKSRWKFGISEITLPAKFEFQIFVTYH